METTSKLSLQTMPSLSAVGSLNWVPVEVQLCFPAVISGELLLAFAIIPYNTVCQIIVVVFFSILWSGGADS